jgi:hypothetical protein
MKLKQKKIRAALKEKSDRNCLHTCAHTLFEKVSGPHTSSAYRKSANFCGLSPQKLFLPTNIAFNTLIKIFTL